MLCWYFKLNRRCCGLCC